MPEAPVQWKAIGAKATGSRHVAANQGCQDGFAIGELPGGGVAAVVADGLGSAEHGANGSRIMSSATVTFVRQQWPGKWPEDARSFLTDCVRSARDELSAHAGDKPLAGFGTTLLVVVCFEARMFQLAVGDSGSVVLKDDNELLHPNAMAEEFANSTVPITSNRWEQNTHAASLEGVRAAMLATDGVLTRVVDANGRIAPQYPSALFAFALKSGEVAAAQERLTKHVLDELDTSDDRTVVLLWRVSATANESRSGKEPDRQDD